MPLRRVYKDQLPKWQPWTLERWILLIGGIAGIAALVVTFFKLDHLREDQLTLFLFSELSLLSIGLVGYLYVTNRKKLHRYAQAVFYLHFINHTIRDQVAAMQYGKPINFEELMQDVVDATANCFSILTARQCRCSVKEIKPDRTVATVVRDGVSSSQSPNLSGAVHKIEDNTDFDNIWYGKGGCTRFFVCRNLVELWRSGKYKNSSFAVRGDPETRSILGLTFVTKWPLPYKSAIVWPIRYIPDACPWPILNDGSFHALPEDKRPFVWGFLCVDFHSRNVFDEIHAPELGAAIADAIFTMFHAARINLGINELHGDQAKQKMPPDAATPPQSALGSTGTKQSSPSSPSSRSRGSR
jgi:hypothetical protein